MKLIAHFRFPMLRTQRPLSKDCATMNESETPPKSDSAPSLTKRVAKCLVKSCVLGGFIGGIGGVLFVVVSAMANGTAHQLGGLAILGFMSWASLGLVVGFVVGVGRSIIIATRP